MEKIGELFEVESPWSLLWFFLTWITLIVLYGNALAVFVLIVFTILAVLLIRDFATRRGKKHWFASSLAEDLQVITYSLLIATAAFVLVVYSLPVIKNWFFVATLIAVPTLFILVFSVDLLHHEYRKDARPVKTSLYHAFLWTIIGTIAVLFFVAGFSLTVSENLRSHETSVFVEQEYDVFSLQQAQAALALEYATLPEPKLACTFCTLDDYAGYINAELQRVIFSTPFSEYDPIDPDLMEEATQRNRFFIESVVRLKDDPFVPVSWFNARYAESGVGDFAWEYSLFEDVPERILYTVGYMAFSDAIQESLVRTSCSRHRVVAKQLWENRNVQESPESEYVRYKLISQYLLSDCVDWKSAYFRT